MDKNFICDEPHIWAMMYATVVGFQYHPKNAPTDRMTLVEAASIADAMYDQYVLRKGPFPKEE